MRHNREGFITRAQRSLGILTRAESAPAGDAQTRIERADQERYQQERSQIEQGAEI